MNKQSDQKKQKSAKQGNAQSDAQSKTSKETEKAKRGEPLTAANTSERAPKQENL